MPRFGEIADVRHPIVFERRDHPRGAPIEARRDVLLPVRDEIALRGLGIDIHVHAEAEPRRLRDVLHHLHLRAVVAHAIDVEPFIRRFNAGGNAVDKRILAPLRAVDPFEPLRRVRARERAEVV